jgi:hypothetical protein
MMNLVLLSTTYIISCILKKTPIQRGHWDCADHNPLFEKLAVEDYRQ